MKLFGLNLFGRDEDDVDGSVVRDRYAGRDRADEGAEAKRQLEKARRALDQKRINDQEQRLLSEGVMHSSTLEEYYAWFEIHFQSPHFNSARVRMVDDIARYSLRDMYTVTSDAFYLIKTDRWCGSSACDFILSAGVRKKDASIGDHCNYYDMGDGSCFRDSPVVVDQMLIDWIKSK